MAIRVSSYEEVTRLIAGNPLRNFPSQSKGRDRLFPVPRPRITTGRTIPADAGFFCLGACFARTVEISLAAAGRRVLSSRIGLGMPGSVEEQFNRYNVFNLDAGMNEVRWALGVHDAPADAPLVKVGHEYADLQLHWAFAHPEDEARHYRKLYNDTFRSIADADVVILAAAGIRQWLDRETGLYINAMPPGALMRAYPDRFEMHEFDVDGCAERLRFAVNVIRENCPRNPLILLAVAPVWQPLSLAAGDSLLDQFKVKATQRLAVERICAEFEGVEYLPALENALLGDFRYGYVDNSPNHTSQNLAHRVVADMLADYGAEDEAQQVLAARAFADAALTAGDPQKALELCQKVAAVGARDPDFSRVFARSLSGVGRQSDAIGFLLDAIEQGNAADPQRQFQMAVQLVKPTDTEIIERLRSVGATIAADDRYLTERLVPRENASDLREAIVRAAQQLKSRDFPAVITALEGIEDRRSTLLPRARERFDLMMLQAMRGLDDVGGATRMVARRMQEGEAHAPVLLKQVAALLSRSRSPDDIALIDELQDIAEAAFSTEQKQSGDAHAGLEKLKTARKKLQLRAQPAPAP